MNRLAGFSIAILAIPIFGCVSAPQAAKSASASAQGQDSESAAGRMIVYTSTIDLETEESGRANAEIIRLVESMKGFVTRNGSDYSIFRVPSGSLNAFLEEVRKIGTVTKSSIAGQDITDAYDDNELKLESLRKLRDKYQSLIEKAVNVQDLVSIERELERVNREIEVLEGKQRQSEKLVEYATITVRYLKKVSPGPIGWIFVGMYYAVKWLFVWE